MARSRQLKPSFFTNEHLADLGPWAMLLFAGLWTLADREGKLEDRPRYIKSQIFPYSEVDVDLELQKLEGAGFIVRYEHSLLKIVMVKTFSRHQSPHREEKPSELPYPEWFTDAGCMQGGGMIQKSLVPSNLLPVPFQNQNLFGDFPSKPEDSADLDALNERVLETANRIHKRHPSHRRGSVSVVKQHLRTIVRPIRGLAVKLAKLEFIDNNHAAWCESDEWTKGEGQYCKSLENWLAPTKFRFEVEPDSRVRSVANLQVITAERKSFEEQKLDRIRDMARKERMERGL